MTARVIAVCAVIAACGNRDTDRIDIAAAASMRHALPELVAEFAGAAARDRITVRYGASDELAALVTAGSGFDLVLLADRQAIATLVDNGHVDAASVRGIARTDIVLAGLPGHGPYTFAELGSLPAHIRVGIGDPALAPIGRYTEIYLRAIGVWDAIQDNAVHGGDVAAVAALVMRREVDMAVIYETDAVAGKLPVLDRARGAAAPHPEIMAGPVRGADGAAQAAEFLAFLASDRASAILARHGFSRP